MNTEKIDDTEKLRAELHDATTMRDLLFIQAPRYRDERDALLVRVAELEAELAKLKRQ